MADPCREALVPMPDFHFETCAETHRRLLLVRRRSHSNSVFRSRPHHDPASLTGVETLPAQCPKSHSAKFGSTTCVVIPTHSETFPCPALGICGDHPIDLLDAGWLELAPGLKG